MKLNKPQFWNNKYSFISILLIPISLIIILLSFLRKKISYPTKHCLSVICVGNLYLGGTGKTPLSIELAKILKKLGKKTALVKKFYPSQYDEINLIRSNKIKLFTNKLRNLAILKAKKNKCNVVVLDDGFQDPSFHKDLSIICFSGYQLVGNGRTIPSGPLREPMQSLKKAKIIIINGKKNNKFEKKILNISRSINIYYSNYKPTNIREFKNYNLLAFAGIGNPNNFFNLLKKNKLKVKKSIAYPDHYKFTKNELLEIISEAKKNNLKIITTEKDYYRMKHFKLNGINFLKVKLEIKNKSKFIKNIIENIK